MAGENDKARTLPAWTLVAIALLGGSGGAVVVPALAPAIYRPEPWTRQDAQAQAEQILRQIGNDVRLAKREADIAIRETEAGIRRDMPPEETKRRIEYMEAMCRRFAEILGIECNPPTARFSSD